MAQVVDGADRKRRKGDIIINKVPLAVTDRSVRVSASGKALITGGYLILKQPNSGLVVATTSRFYSTAQWVQGGVDQNISEGPTLQLAIVVHSPQFNTTTTFDLKLNGDDQVNVTQRNLKEGEKPNLYILAPIKLAARLK